MGGSVMKSKFIILAVLALIISACSTGSYVTSSWVDDIYFSPGDIPPPVLADKTSPEQKDLRSKSAERVIISEIRDTNEGSKTMKNYIFDGQDVGTYTDAQLFNLDQMELVETDTTIYYDENEVKYVINNYFEGEDIDFSYRINRFHRPFGYDPYFYDYYGWDSWYHPYSSFGWSHGWGWNSWAWRSSMFWPYSGWGYPFYGWHSPYYSYWGWGGFPYYYSSWHSPYFGGFWGNIRYIDREDYRYGPRRDYNTSAVYGDSGARRSGVSAISNNDSPLKSARPVTADIGTDARRNISVSGVAGGGRTAREGSITGTEQSARTHTELRRDPSETTNTRSRYTSSTAVRGANEPSVNSGVQSQSTTTRNNTGTPQGTYTRPVTNTNNVRSANTNDYTPSYNQPRTVTRQTYNVQGTERPSSTNQGTVTKSAATPSSTYTRPSSTSSNTTRTYRSTTTYNRSSSTGTSSGSSVRTVAPSSNSNYSTPARSSSPASSGSSYSAPARSSSPASSGSGSFSSGGSSGGSSSRSGSSSSGRR